MDPDQQSSTSDFIIDEIHATRQKIAERFGGDLNLMLADARKRQELSGRPIWRPKVANQSTGDGTAHTPQNSAAG